MKKILNIFNIKDNLVIIIYNSNKFITPQLFLIPGLFVKIPIFRDEWCI
jgi:hypothetical protein